MVTTPSITTNAMLDTAMTAFAGTANETFGIDVREGLQAAIDAAMPEIRKAIAHELDMAVCTDPNCCPGQAAAREIILGGFQL